MTPDQAWTLVYGIFLIGGLSAVLFWLNERSDR